MDGTYHGEDAPKLIALNVALAVARQSLPATVLEPLVISVGSCDSPTLRES